MSARARKLIGGFILIGFIAVYAAEDAKYRA
jgi:hypothetical protein